MRLNTYTKQAIVSSIINDVPKLDEAALKDSIQAALVAAMTPDVQRIYKTKPDVLRRERIPSYEVGVLVAFDTIVADLKGADVRKVLKPFRDAHEERQRIMRQVTSAINTCVTLKQLTTLLPEFKKYYPTEEAPTKNLPALANIVADLSKLGWPKGATK